jgi:sulfotransferase family protein
LPRQPMIATGSTEIPRYERKPIFVVGAPRSGTTLTSRILGEHPDIYAPGETHFFEYILPKYKCSVGFSPLDDTSLVNLANDMFTAFGRHNQESQAEVDTLLSTSLLSKRALDEGGKCEDVYFAFMILLTEYHGSSRFCDDTPKHLFHLDTIFDLFPYSKVVACVRDPRDFLCSYKYFWRKSRHGKRLKSLYHPIVTSLLWRSSAGIISQISSRPYANQVAIIRYEDLVSDPENTIKDLCANLDIQYTDNLVNTSHSNSSFDMNTETDSKPIYTDSIGRWRNCLTPAEIWWCQQLNKSYLDIFGYPKEDVTVDPFHITATLATTPIGFSKALWANRGRRGSLPQYLYLRIKEALR